MSKCEEKIEYILQKQNMEYVREKTYYDLRYGKLRYDFYLPQQNILIEYDSELHFYQIPKFHKTQQDFKHAQENDRIKNSYALSHSIPLYRIPYWAFKDIHSFNDIIQEKYLVQNRWHNDTTYREYKGRGHIV